MGRYTTVQAFKDTDTRVPALSYEVATGQPVDTESGEIVAKAKKKVEYDEHGRKKGLTEKVVNAYGSTAGAGSGEFHTYRHARDREQRRLDRNAKIKQKTEAQKVFFILFDPLTYVQKSRQYVKCAGSLTFVPLIILVF